MTTLQFRKSIGRSLSWRCGFVLLALACFTSVQNTQAVNPAPDGGYPGANTAEGTDALFSLTSGIANTAVGLNALHDNTIGGFNVAVGSSALAHNISGNFNMAIGTDALRDNTSNFNLAIGFRVGFMNTTGNHLTGIGAAALRNNTTASFNTAIGADALRENTTGEDNTAIGADALAQNTLGEDNTAIGVNALSANNGDQNIAIGDDAMLNATLAFSNTVVGNLAGTNIAIGVQNTYIGAFVGPAADESFTVRIADTLNGIPGSQCFIGGITGNAGANFTDTVILDPLTGQLGDMVSSAQFKKDIDPMDKTSEAIFSLRPVTFHYKNDPTNTPQFGLIAEEVAKVNPALVGVDKEGKPHSVQYMKVEAMLLNEFLKEHKKGEEQQSKIDNQQASIAELKARVAQQAKGMEVLTAQLKEQGAQIQKVSAQLEASKPAPQVVNNP